MKPFQDLPRSRRRVLLLRILLQAIATAVVLTALYYLLPLDNLSRASSAAFLSAGLIGVIGLIVWELRAILKARYPGLRAIQALALIAPIFLLVFATGYFLLGRSSPASFTEPLSRTAALYFTMTTFSTVGYGDIAPRTDTARIIVMVQMTFDLVLIGVGVKLLFGAVQMGRERAAGGGGGGGGGQRTAAAPTAAPQDEPPTVLRGAGSVPPAAPPAHPEALAPDG